MLLLQYLFQGKPHAVNITVSHGNSKMKVPHVPTKKGLLTTVKERLKDGETPSHIYTQVRPTN